jgi:cytidine deaminase
MTPEQLIEAARTAARNAYAPYSRFAVGAAVLLDDGSVVTGANFENASYGLSLCAETVALAAANAQGRLRDVVSIAVVGGMIGDEGPGDIAVLPCGRCRQVINEAAQAGKREILLYCAGPRGGAITTHKLSDLLPYAFGPADLGV